MNLLGPESETLGKGLDPETEQVLYKTGNMHNDMTQTLRLLKGK